MHLTLSSEANLILSRIGKIADTLQIKAYAVGGFVRDTILGREVKDLDILCVNIDAYIIAEQYKLNFCPQSIFTLLQNLWSYSFTRWRFFY